MENKKLIAAVLILFAFDFSYAAKQKSKAKVASVPKTVELEKPKEGEVKILLNSTSQVIAWLKSQKSEFTQQHLFFFDTDKLDLYQKGTILRIRRYQDDKFDVTAKLLQKEITEAPNYSAKSKKN